MSWVLQEFADRKLQAAGALSKLGMVALVSSKHVEGKLLRRYRREEPQHITTRQRRVRQQAKRNSLAPVNAKALQHRHPALNTPLVPCTAAACAATLVPLLAASCCTVGLPFLPLLLLLAAPTLLL
jgi:hypothetical protein